MVEGRDGLRAYLHYAFARWGSIAYTNRPVTTQQTAPDPTLALLPQFRAWHWCVWSLCSLLATPASWAQHTDAPEYDPLPTLHWRNGDTLEGRLRPSQGDRLGWENPLFTAPFDLAVGQLEQIRFPQGYMAAEPGTAPIGAPTFRITFRNGDRLQGELVGIDAQSITLRCQRIRRDVTVDRSQLSRIENIRSEFLTYSGPIELDSWRSLHSEAQNRDWYQQHGSFVSNRWGSELFRPIALPKQAEIAFSLHFPYDRPSIDIGLTEAAGSGPRIETWDDTLVLTYDNRFAAIETLAADRRHLQYRIFWDQVRETVQVCDPDGRVLAMLEDIELDLRVAKAKATPVSKKGKTSTSRRWSRDNRNRRDPHQGGFRLQHRSTELRFTSLSVRQWDGRPVPVYDADRPRVELAGGQVVFELAEVAMVADLPSSIQVEGRSIPMGEVRQLVFSTAPSDRSQSDQQVQLAYRQGELISGSIDSIDPTQAVIQPVWASGDLDIQLSDAKQMLFPRSSTPIQLGADRLKSQSLDLGGQVTPGSNDLPHTLLAWRPVGANQAVPLSETEEVEVTREAYPGATDMIGDARLYLENEEVLSGKLIAIDDKKVDFSSYITGRISIPTEHIRAVDIEGAGIDPFGFGDPGWVSLPPAAPVMGGDMARPSEGDDGGEEKKPAVELSAEKVTLREGAFGHLNLLMGNEINFKAKWDSSYGIFTLRLFGADFHKDSDCAKLLIGCQGNRIVTGRVRPQGGWAFDGEQVRIDDQQADIQVRIEGDRIEVWVDGKLSLPKKNDRPLLIEPSQISGNGIVFEMGGGWRGWEKTPTPVEISHFSVDRSPGFLPRRVINRAAKERALIVPRFHRDEPPTHVLVAPNGDLLRGQLRSATSERIAFTSRGEQLELPRSRVSAIIWLRAAPEAGDREPRSTTDEQSSTTDSDDRSAPSGTESPVVSTTGAGDTGEPSEPPAELISSYLVTHQIILHDGSRLNLAAESIDETDEIFIGRSEILGLCRVPLHAMRYYTQGPAHPLTRSTGADQMAYTDWLTRLTPDPKIPAADGSGTSPLVDQPAADFSLPLLSGGTYTLSQKRGRVVVLDFWATWCGPCIRAMPDVLRAAQAFPGQPVDLIAVNQAETEPIINQFLEARGWTGLSVGLDHQLEVARDYQVKAIPHTVVIDTEGKISWVHTGASQDLAQNLANAIGRALQKRR